MNEPNSILVIDDEPVITQAVSRICSVDGWKVDVAESGSTALELVGARSYKIILCDLMMTGIDGFQFLDEIARQRVSSPVIMMTGFATVENAVKSLKHGAYDFIAKPFTSDELLLVVKRTMCARALQDEFVSPGRREHLPYVPCPAKYFRLGYVSWAKSEHDGTAIIGLHDLFLKSLEGVAAVELLPRNSETIQGNDCAVIVSATSGRHGVMCPVSGRVVEINEAAVANPLMVEKDPYFNGWLYRVVPAGLDLDLQNLMPCSSDRL